MPPSLQFSARLCDCVRGNDLLLRFTSGWYLLHACIQVADTKSIEYPWPKACTITQSTSNGHLGSMPIRKIRMTGRTFCHNRLQLQNFVSANQPDNAKWATAGNCFTMPHILQGLSPHLHKHNIIHTTLLTREPTYHPSCCSNRCSWLLIRNISPGKIFRLLKPCTQCLSGKVVTAEQECHARLRTELKTQPVLRLMIYWNVMPELDWNLTV